MFVLGLTGSIAMGKSTASGLFRCFGVPVFDADAAVHRLFLPSGAAVRPVLEQFPGTGSKTAGIDRPELGARVFDDAPALARLEAIVHPLVRAAQRRFLGSQAAARRRLVVMDIPLLFETGGDALMDAVAVVSASRYLQATRVLRRPGMTEARLQAILGRQMPDAEKRRRADFVIPSGLDRRTALGMIGTIVERTRQRQGRAWPARWQQTRRKALA
jgi:dephospho-CoA kinase